MSPELSSIPYTGPHSVGGRYHLDVAELGYRRSWVNHFQSTYRTTQPWLTSFTLFLKLPTEIQYQIWKLFLREQHLPQVVALEVQWYKGHLYGTSPPVNVKLRNILRVGMNPGQGYLNLLMLRPCNEPVNFIFHPDFDMLYLTHETIYGLRHDSFVAGLRKAGAFDKLRFLAVDFKTMNESDSDRLSSENKLERFLIEFKDCKNLELVFVVGKWGNRAVRTRGRNFRFERVGKADYEGFMYWGPRSMLKYGDDRKYELSLTTMMKGGEKKDLPKVVLVKKIRSD